VTLVAMHNGVVNRFCLSGRVFFSSINRQSVDYLLNFIPKFILRISWSPRISLKRRMSRAGWELDPVRGGLSSSASLTTPLLI